MDPLVAEDWMRRIEKVLNTIKLTLDEDRNRSVAHQLGREANQWWRDKQETIDTRALTW